MVTRRVVVGALLAAGICLLAAGPGLLGFLWGSVYSYCVRTRSMLVETQEQTGPDSEASVGGDGQLARPSNRTAQISRYTTTLSTKGSQPALQSAYSVVSMQEQQ